MSQGYSLTDPSPGANLPIYPSSLPLECGNLLSHIFPKSHVLSKELKEKKTMEKKTMEFFLQLFGQNFCFVSGGLPLSTTLSISHFYQSKSFSFRFFTVLVL
jgi:hypothetical protein